MRAAFAGLVLCLQAAVLAAAEPPVRADAEKGRAIATQTCAACHGTDGNSPSPANPRLGGQIREYLQKQLANFKAADGKKPERASPVMGAMAASLSIDDIRNVAAYYGSQKPSLGLAKNMETVYFGRKIYRGGRRARAAMAPTAPGSRFSIRVLPGSMPNIPKRSSRRFAVASASTMPTG